MTQGDGRNGAGRVEGGHDTGPAAPTVAGLLREARTLGLDRLDAQVLLGTALARPRAWLIAHDDAPVATDAAARFRADATRRADGVPLAYLLGTKEFHGLALAVTPDVLVPRPDTETLVGWVLDLLAAGDGAFRADANGAGSGEGRYEPADGTTGRRPPDGVGPWHAGPWGIADLGTGSGAIALAIADACARAGRAAAVCAVEASPAALAVARGNGERLGLTVEWLHGDWWQPLAGRRFDLVVSNPPYVAAGDAHLEALRHEPRSALVAGADGFDDLRAIVAGAPRHLVPGGWLLLEHGFDQAAAVRALLRDRGFEAVTTRRDLAGVERCTGGRLAG